MNKEFNNNKKKLFDRKHLKRHKKDILYLRGLSKKYNIPLNLLVGIYIIETYFRPWYLRLIEYVLVICGLILNIFFKRPLKNYTIGKCQIGLSSIMIFYGKKTYKHIRYINFINKEDLLNIIKSFHYKRNFEICAKMVSSFYKRSLRTAKSYNFQLRHIGEEFNGRYSYGLMLEEIVSLLDRGYFKI